MWNSKWPFTQAQIANRFEKGTAKNHAIISWVNLPRDIAPRRKEMHAGQNTESGNLALMERRPCVNRQRAPGGRRGAASRDTERERGWGRGRFVVGWCECVFLYIHTYKQGWGLKGLTVSCLKFLWCNQHMQDMLFGKNNRASVATKRGRVLCVYSLCPLP